MPRTHSRDLTGKRFGLLDVIEETDERAVNGSIIWRCRCRCRKTDRVEVLVITSNLTSKNTQSCGCVQVARSRAANRKGGRRWQKNL